MDYEDVCSAAAVGRISERRERDGHVVVVVVLYAEHHIDERIERFLTLRLEVWRREERQFVCAFVVFAVFLFEEVLHPAIVIGDAPVYDIPRFVGVHLRQHYGNACRGASAVDVEDVT